MYNTFISLTYILTVESNGYNKAQETTHDEKHMIAYIINTVKPRIL